jgi:hypothetical protein
MALRLAILNKPLSARLWIAGGAIGAFLLILIVGNLFSSGNEAVTRKMLGHDFLAFYTAGTFVREGRGDELYDLRAVESYQRDLMTREGLEVRKSFGPYWNPPFYAWVFVPFSSLPYSTALNVWLGINLLALMGAMTLLVRLMRNAESGVRNDTCNPHTPRNALCTPHSSLPFATWGLVPLLVLTSMPFMQALSHGQNTFTSLLILTGVVSLWRRKRAVFAGIVAGLLFYKPQLGAIIAMILVIDLGWKALAGLCVTGIMLAGVTLMTLPGTIATYLHQLPLNVREFQVLNPYLWERHATFKAFLRLLFQGGEVGEMSSIATGLWILCIGVFGIALIAAAVRTLWHRECNDAPSRDRLISATICTMPLLMPFYFDYDLMLLAVPCVLFASEMISTDATKENRWLVRGWMLLGAWMLINPGLSRTIRVNGDVILLAGISAMMIWRLWAAQGVSQVVDANNRQQAIRNEQDATRSLAA